MSTTTILRSSAVGAICIAGLSFAVSANAQGSRYGNVHAYESGSNCQVQPCATTHTQSSRYGGSYVEQAPAAPVYVDCQTTFGPQCGAPVVQQPTTVYTAPPAPAYTQPAPTYQSQSTYTESYSAPSYAQAPANCPAGTTAQPDGTCLQGSGYSSYGTGSVTLPETYNQTYSDSYSSTMTDSYSTYSGPPANCPAGTTAQDDGTCLQTGGSYGSTSTYSSGTTYSGGSVELYSGDAEPTQPAEPTYGYTSDGSYTVKDYRPMRK